MSVSQDVSAGGWLGCPGQQLGRAGRGPSRKSDNLPRDPGRSCNSQHEHQCVPVTLGMHTDPTGCSSGAKDDGSAGANSGLALSAGRDHFSSSDKVDSGKG